MRPISPPRYSLNYSSELARMPELQINSNSFKSRSFKVIQQMREAKGFCDVTLSGGPQAAPPCLLPCAEGSTHSPHPGYEQTTNSFKTWGEVLVDTSCSPQVWSGRACPLSPPPSFHRPALKETKPAMPPHLAILPPQQPASSRPGVHKTWAWGMPCPCDSRP